LLLVHCAQLLQLRPNITPASFLSLHTHKTSTGMPLMLRHTTMRSDCKVKQAKMTTA
jgi:hypothetical protein